MWEIFPPFSRIFIFIAVCCDIIYLLNVEKRHELVIGGKMRIRIEERKVKFFGSIVIKEKITFIAKIEFL
jgi:hypothetical protein